MPIYEYECTNCGHRFEQLQKITDKQLRTCPECKKPKLHKLVSNTSFQLKGTGWYVTDFKNKKSEKEKSETVKGAPKKDETSASAEKSKPKTENKKGETKAA